MSDYSDYVPESAWVPETQFVTMPDEFLPKFSPSLRKQKTLSHLAVAIRSSLTTAIATEDHPWTRFCSGAWEGDWADEPTEENEYLGPLIDDGSFFGPVDIDYPVIETPPVARLGNSARTVQLVTADDAFFAFADEIELTAEIEYMDNPYISTDDNDARSRSSTVSAAVYGPTREACASALAEVEGSYSRTPSVEIFPLVVAPAYDASPASANIKHRQPFAQQVHKTIAPLTERREPTIRLVTEPTSFMVEQRQPTIHIITRNTRYTPPPEQLWSEQFDYDTDSTDSIPCKIAPKPKRGWIRKTVKRILKRFF